ncbi:MAG TPA: HPr family phosphocarrier protein [Thermodesulfobacteriota bacterium]|nr:HPr family phosphocarrier protein [Thermodesulfobacteriota bacterium]
MTKPFTEIISETDFLPLAQTASHEYLKICNYLEDRRDGFTQKFYMHVIKESLELEDFLDDHGARTNRNWVYFGELVASSRNFGRIAYTLIHVLRRYNFYHLEGSRVKGFLSRARETMDFLNQSIIALFEAIGKECKRLGLKLPVEKIDDEDFQEVTPTKVLPHNIGEEEGIDEKKNALKIATDYINIAKRFMGLECVNCSTPQQLKDIIPCKVSEDKLREFQYAIHNHQSIYDTYIKNTSLETESSSLKSLRGYISLALHLLEIACWLSHFYERHESEIRHEKTKKKIEKVINKELLLENVINFSLYYAQGYLQEGTTQAHNILKAYTEIDTIELKIPEGLGFHLRPSTLVAKVVNYYGSTVMMMVKDKRFNASSPIEMMWAGGMLKRENIDTVKFEGDKRVLHDLQILSGVNYGEDIIGKSIDLPKELAYLNKS